MDAAARVIHDPYVIYAGDTKNTDKLDKGGNGYKLVKLFCLYLVQHRLYAAPNRGKAILFTINRAKPTESTFQCF